MANFHNIPRKSLQQIQTSMDDDIVDMLKSSKLKRYFGEEIEHQQQQHPSRKHRKHKIKQLFNNNQRHKNKKHRKKRKQNPNTPECVSSNSNITKFKPHKNYKDKYGRSRSVPRIQPIETDNLPKVNRLQSFFEKLNNLKDYKPERKYSNRSNRSNDIPITPCSTTSTTTTTTTTPITPSLTITRNHIGKSITWRPLLKDIYNDKQLLNALIAFMERIYCEENILFLQAVQQFKCTIDQYIDSDEKQSQIECSLTDNIKRDIDFKIYGIYNAYIVSNAQYQVNLSYDCFTNSLGRREQISTLSLHQKREIFDNCVDEIERLIMSSVLSPFYDSAEFAVVAQQRPRSNGIGIGLEYNRNSIKIRKKFKKSIVKLIEKSPIIKQNSKSYNNKYDIDSNDDSIFDDDIQQNDELIFDDEQPYPIPYNIKTNTSSLNTVSKLVKVMSQSTESLYDFGGSTKSIASAVSAPIKRKDSNSNYLLSYNTQIISPISTDISNTIEMSNSPLSLSQSKSEQFDITNSFCSPEPIANIIKYRKQNNIIEENDEHIKTQSDGQIFQQFQKIQKLQTNTNKNKKKYSNSKTKSPKKHKDKKHKKRLKKKKKKRLAMDDGKIKSTHRKNKIKKLKKINKISLRKRRKSNNDSDILLMLYRDNTNDKQSNINNANNKKQNHMV